MMGLLGGGKRGRGGGGNKLSRDDKIEEKRNELNLTLLQLDQYKANPIVASTLSSVSIFTGGLCPTIINDAMDNVLSMDQLRTLHSGMTTHMEDNRINMIPKHIFMRDINASSDAKKAMELNLKAIESAVGLGFYTNYYMENGTLDWMTYAANIMKV